MLDILIVLPTHSKSNAGPYTRYCSSSKLEVTKRCFRSLIKTIQHCQQKENAVQYRLVVLDDRSDQEFLDEVVQCQKQCSFSVELRKSSSQGNMASIGEMYKIGKLEGKNLIYFAQDDYLHYETALWEMIDAYFQFKKMSGFEVCIYPFDDPFRYSSPKYTSRYSHKIVLGAKRHWRTGYCTAAGFMVSHYTLSENWHLFEGLSKQEYNNECEDRTINRLFINMVGLEQFEIKHILFTPIPSLVLHLGDESTKDPYLDWKKLWDQFDDNHSLTDLNLPEK